jgi:hypothetical protein
MMKCSSGVFEIIDGETFFRRLLLQPVDGGVDDRLHGSARAAADPVVQVALKVLLSLRARRSLQALGTRPFGVIVSTGCGRIVDNFCARSWTERPDFAESC